MKLSSACVVLAAFAAAAAPARANPLVATTVSFVSEVFVRLIQTQTLIKSVDKKNYEELSPALNDLSRELHQGLNSDIFKIGSGIHNTLVDVNLKIGQISGNASSILSQIEFVAHAVSSLNFSNARFDYDIKRSRIRKLCNDTLAMTTVVLGLIDETKELLGKGVSGPLKTLQLTIQLTSGDRLIRERANIQLQQSIITNPPRFWLFFRDYEAVEVAERLKQVGESTVNRIEKLVASILTHAKWLEDVCHTIREELDNERTDISKIEGKIKGAREIVNAISDEFGTTTDSQIMTVEVLREGSKNLVQVMNDLRDEVVKITRNRLRRAAEPYDDAAMEHYQIGTEHTSLAVYPQQTAKPSWLDKTPDNRCYYIYNNRTTGCIFAQTFNYMKEQYTSLSKKVLEFETLFKAYENGWNNLATQVLRVSKNTANRGEVIKFVADLDTNKLMWSDDIKKLRDLCVSLNSYAESLFSEANAQLKLQSSHDNTLNEGVVRAVDDNKKTAKDILTKNENDILIIHNLVADILNRLSINDPCSDGFAQLPPGSYSNYGAPSYTNRPLQSDAASNVPPGSYSNYAAPSYTNRPLQSDDASNVLPHHNSMPWQQGPVPQSHQPGGTRYGTNKPTWP